MRHLASALKKLDSPTGIQGSAHGPNPARPHIEVTPAEAAATTAARGSARDRASSVAASDRVAERVEYVHTVAAHLGAPSARTTVHRIDPHERPAMRPHYESDFSSPVLLDSVASSGPRQLADANGPPRYHHQYQQILARLRERGTSTRSSTVALFGVTPLCPTAHLVRDLASSLLQQGEGPILMVDGNFWERKLSLLCDAGEANGFSDVMAGWPWRNVLITSQPAELALIPAGSGFVQRMDGLSWGGLMDEWRDAYRWVLLDGGPADAWLADGLCTACDQVVLHSTLDHSSSPELRSATKRLRRLGGRLMGSIFTSMEWRNEI